MDKPKSSSPESPAKEQPGEQKQEFSYATTGELAKEFGASDNEAQAIQARVERLAGATLNAAPQAGQHSLGRAFDLEGHAVGPAVAAPDVAAMVKRLRAVSANSLLCQEAAALIEKLGQGWIPVSERLPKNNDRCLYFDGEVDVARGWWIKDMTNKITHWQPLPPPPERP